MGRKHATKEGVTKQDGAGDLPPLPKGWCWTTVGELLIEPTCNGISVKGSDSPPGVPALRLSAMTDAGFDYQQTRYIPISPKIADKLSVRKNDFFVSRGNGSLHLLGRPTLAQEPPCSIVFPDTMIRLRFADLEPLPKYMNYLWSSRFIRSQIESRARTTAGIYKISQRDVESFVVPIPPVHEQHRIVRKLDQLFSDLDAGVATLERVRTTLKLYRTSVLKAAVEGRLTEEWRAKHPDVEPGSALLDRILAERRRCWEERQLAKFAETGKQPPKGWQTKYKEPISPDTADVPPHPESWCVVSIDQLCVTLTSGSRDWSQYYDRGSGTFLMAQNIRMGRLDLSYRQQVDAPQDSPDRSRSQVEKGDILITIVGANTGDVCRVPSPLPEHYVCQSVALARPVRQEFSQFIEEYLISDENGQRQFKRYIYGAGRPHLSFDQIKMTAILIPPVEEQEQIVVEIDQKLSIVEEIESQIEANLKRASRLRQSILKRAFEGQLVSQEPGHEPADEPADHFLECIRGGERSGELAELRVSEERRDKHRDDSLLLFDVEGNGRHE